MDIYATNKATHLKLEIGREDSEQLQTITRHIGLKIDSSQATMLQPVTGNGAGRKAKSKTKMGHSSKKQPSSITAFKMIAKQGADEKAQLEKWKAKLMTTLMSKVD